MPLINCCSVKSRQPSPPRFDMTRSTAQARRSNSRANAFIQSNAWELPIRDTLASGVWTTYLLSLGRMHRNPPSGPQFADGRCCPSPAQKS
jgi:hypothetical protein